MNVERTEVERRLDRFRAACRQAGVKVTQQRLEIFRELAGRSDHPTAEMVFRALQPRLPTVSLDTIYRTLWLLAELRLIHPLGPRRESMRFDANLEEHHHYVCLRCGMTRDFESQALEGVELSAAVRTFGSVATARLEVRGVCSACAEVAGASETQPKQPGDR